MLIRSDFNPYVSVNSYRYGLIVASVLFASFGFIDWHLIKDRELLAHTLLVRYLLIVPAYIIVFFLSYHKLFKQHQPLLSFLLGICSLGGVVILLFLAKRAGQDYYDLYFTAFMVAVSFAPLVLWYNKFYMFISLPVIILFFNLTSLYAVQGQVNLTYVLLQNILLATGGMLGSYCRIFVMTSLKWNIHKTNVISRRKQLLEQVHQKLESSDKRKRLLLSVLSHDIQGPMNNVQALLEMLTQGLITPQEFSQYATNLNCQLTHTKGILDSVLLWSKSEMNLAADFEAIELHRVVSENLAAVELAARQKNNLLHNHIDTGLSYTGDLQLVKLILRNLLANAIKFTDNGNIIVSSFQQGGLITLLVQDDGIGMDKKDAEQLFRPEVHFTRQGTRAEKGTGLGLTLCYEVVKKYGGHLTVDSEKGRGTTFCFTLPPDRTETGRKAKERVEEKLKEMQEELLA